MVHRKRMGLLRGSPSLFKLENLYQAPQARVM